MGQEVEKAQRTEVFGRYQVNSALMAQAADDAWFMHCLPAYRGHEVSCRRDRRPSITGHPAGPQPDARARGVLAFVMGVRP